MKNVADTLASRLICAALVVYALGLFNPGKGMAGPGYSEGRDAVEDAIRDMQWRENVERQRTPASPRSAPAPAQLPAVQQPDLSGLPKQLPQDSPSEPQPVEATTGPALTMPKLHDEPAEKQTLIKPRIGKAPDPGRRGERTPKAGKRALEPAQQPRNVQGQPYRSQVQGGAQHVRQPVPVPIPQQATATRTQPVAPLTGPQETVDRRTGLIKPRLGALTPEMPRLEPRTTARQQEKQTVRAQPPVRYAPSSYQQPPRQQARQLPPVQRPAVQPQAPAQPRQYYPQYPQVSQTPQPLIKPQMR